MRALVDEPLVYRRGFLLLLTAARSNELFGAPASEIVDGLWTLPADRSKNGEENYVALGPWGYDAHSNALGVGCDASVHFRDPRTGAFGQAWSVGGKAWHLRHKGEQLMAFVVFSDAEAFCVYMVAALRTNTDVLDVIRCLRRRDLTP
ncbi:MAG TPA: hypothetical protein VFF98_10920 [Novosphingobium sp.]|nr:hypothetical protein [Novosphingobium sp.]